jgi:serine/threonine-protein kinase
LAREASIYGHLDGGMNPALVAEGRAGERGYLVVEWRQGRDVSVAADAIRTAAVGGRYALLSLCVDIIAAFAHLHRQGVVHGDVHPRNILVDDSGRVTILDYGLARLPQGPEALRTASRGGAGFFFEPEFAAAQLQDREPPQADEAGEQYSLAALVYLLLAGRHHCDFSFDERTALQQIRDDPPASFASIGHEPWPEVESVLAVALDKAPARRFTSVAEFAQRLGQVCDAGTDRAAGGDAMKATRPPRAFTSSSSLDLFLTDVVAAFGPGARLARNGLPGAPSCSVHSGASGIAYALYRVACEREDALLLANADFWSARAMAHSNDPQAYFKPGTELTAEGVGVASLVHSATGTAFVDALIALAAGDFFRAQQSIDLFVSLAAGRPCRNPDLFLGRAGLLVGCAQLVEAAKHAAPPVEIAPLERLGRDLARMLWSELAADAPLASGPAIDNLGAAHGWSGMLYALMRWGEASQAPMPDGLPERLHQLAACAVPAAAGVRWPIRLPPSAGDGDRNRMNGWCNGGAGHVDTWLLAHALFGDAAFLDLAVRSGAQAFAESFPQSTPALCCGKTGVAFALLSLYRATRDRHWLEDARRLAEAAASEIRSPLLPEASLFQGAAGLAVLVAGLDQPESATMPVFGREI